MASKSNILSVLLGAASMCVVLMTLSAFQEQAAHALIQTRRIEIVDKAGGVLAALDGESGIVFSSEPNGKVAVRLGCDGLVLGLPKSTTTISNDGIMILDGATEGNDDPSSRKRVWLATDGMKFHNGEGQMVALIAANPVTHAGFLSLHAKEGAVEVLIASSPVGGLITLDGPKKARLFLTAESQEPSTKDGK